MDELTILLPCLNEENTLDKCIKDIHKVMDKSRIPFSILLCDNNSNDSSIEIAKLNKTNYVIEQEKGYGSTLINGINNVHTKYAIMLDCDSSYDVNDIPLIYNELKNGYDLVIGNRFKGIIEKSAMPLSHKIGSKILTEYANLLFKTKAHDFHCGLRGFDVEKIKSCNLKSKGMEFASEMIIKAKLNKLNIKEIKTNYYKDLRGKKGHLKTFRDGFRHLHLINSLKFENSLIFRYVSTFILTLLLMNIFLFLSILIPNKTTDNHVIESLDYYHYYSGYVLDRFNIDSYVLDYQADTYTMNIIYNLNNKKPVSSLIEMNYNPRATYSAPDFNEAIKNNEYTANYSRYWHGEISIIKPLLIIFSAKTIYSIQLLILCLLYIILILKMFKHSKLLPIVYTLGLIMINYFVTASCFEFYFVFLISAIASIIGIKLYETNNTKYLPIFFFIVGMITCFTDFLSCETVTLTIPLIIITYIDKCMTFKKIIKIMVNWLSAYSLTFMTKWLIDTIHYNGHFMDYIGDSILYRGYTNKIDIYLLFKKLTSYLLINDIHIWIFIIIVALVILIFKIKHKKQYLMLLMISLVPIVRFIIMTNHSYNHAYFTYRAFIPLIITLLIIIIKGLPIFKNKKIIDNKL
ncbi:MAG TPA: glycosyltransferase family 2 protein [Bacilli bacterium]|jgi:hypothetical protein|nr:glycosyltransferase family 2 protein [Bacilli bacterium]HQC83539.1 glycosyltransferase family 2 protein [Bacilli bacterium]